MFKNVISKLPRPVNKSLTTPVRFHRLRAVHYFKPHFRVVCTTNVNNVYFFFFLGKNIRNTNLYDYYKAMTGTRHVTGIFFFTDF